MILPKISMNSFVSLVGLIRKHNLLEYAYISRMKKRRVSKLNKDFDTKRQKELAEEQRKDEQFFVNYNPLANSAFGVPGKLSEMPRIKWGPGRFGKDHIHHKEYKKIVFTGMDSEEEEYYNDAQREEEMEIAEDREIEEKEKLANIEQGDLYTVG